MHIISQLFVFLLLSKTNSSEEETTDDPSSSGMGEFGPSEGDNPKPMNTLVLDTPSGKLRGEVYQLKDGSKGVRYLGIPYAMPPTGERRFKDPEPFESWEGIRDATKFGPICYQPLESDVWDLVNDFKSDDIISTNSGEIFEQTLRTKITEVEDLVNEMKLNLESFANSSKFLKSNFFDSHSNTEDVQSRKETLLDDVRVSNPSTTGDVSTIFESASKIDENPYLENLEKTSFHASIRMEKSKNSSFKANYIENFKPVQKNRRKQKIRKIKTNINLHIKQRFLSQYTMAEDCLSLNVYTPLIPHHALNTEALLPIIVYVHGGSFYSNGGRLYPGERLAAEGVVVVTFNYRLGPFGFLSTGDSVAKGNWGLQDQRMALIWVQKHLKALNGDKNKILLVGNSAGGSSVVLHMLSPLTKGLFTRVAAMSGCSLAPWSIQKDPIKSAKKLATGLKCPLHSSEGIINCLRLVTAEALNEEFTINSVQDGLWLSFAPVIEKTSSDAFISRSPRQLLTEGSFHKVPLLLSLTRDEVTIWFRNHPEMMQKVAVEEWINRIIKQIYSGFSKEELGPLRHVIRGFYIYSKGFSPSNLSIAEHEELPSNGDGEKVPTKIIANLFSDIGLRVPCMEEVNLLSDWTDTYVSEFSYASLDDIRIGSHRWIGSYHESDLQYIFGQPLLGIKNSLRHENDSEVARLSMSIMKSFANYGAPKLPSNFNITWPKYEKNSKIHLELCDQPKLGKELLQDRQYFWLKFVPLLVNWPYQANSSFEELSLSWPNFCTLLAMSTTSLLISFILL